MKKIFELQEAVQHAMARHGKIDIDLALGQTTSIGETYDYVSSLRFFIEEEISELLEELGGGSRNIHKPWHDDYNKLRDDEFVSTSKVKSEAIDVLCFAINLCLSVGVNKDNIEEEYLKVHKKIVSRLDSSNRGKYIKLKGKSNEDEA